jgi:predicted ABC-type ATPase
VDASLLVVTGPPGAGKSTVARLVSQHFDVSVLVEGDAFFGFLDRGSIAPWLPEADAQNEIVVRAAAAAAGTFAVSYVTVYDGIIGPWFLPAFREATGLAVLHYAVLLPGVDECVGRVSTRQGHGFRDAAATRHMHGEFSRACRDLEQRHVVIAEPPDAVAGEVLRRWRAGELLVPSTP